MIRSGRPVALAIASLALALVMLLPSELAANVDVRLSLAELTRSSTGIATVTCVERHSEWEGARIITLSRVHVDSVLAGELPTAEPIVRTLGGSVGRLAQIVEGEPELAPGSRAVLFLRERTAGGFQVSGRGQGQFPIVASSEGRPFLVRHPGLGMLVDLPGRPNAKLTAAVSVLHGLSVDAAQAAIQLAWEKTHAR